MENLEGVLAIFMSLAIPIVVIVFGCMATMNKKNREVELRKLLIENNVDMERAKLLIAEQEKKDNKFAYLRGGLMMLGLGLGTLVNYMLHILNSNVYFWLIIAVGVGIGMLVSFFVEMKLTERAKKLSGNDLQKEEL